MKANKLRFTKVLSSVDSFIKSYQSMCVRGAQLDRVTDLGEPFIRTPLEADDNLVKKLTLENQLKMFPIDAARYLPNLKPGATYEDVLERL